VSHLLLALMKLRASAPVVALQALFVAGVLARWHFAPRLSAASRRAADAAIVLAALAWTLLGAADAWSNIRHPRPWDFPSFYAVADAAAHGRSFYDPHVLTAVQDELTRTQGVPRQWLSECGYWYLPPSVLLILPLGALRFRAAIALHYLVQGALLAGAALLLARRWPNARGLSAFASALLVLLAFPPVQSTIYFAQIVFGCLFCLMLAEALLERWPIAAGAALALGFFYKHLLLVSALVPLLGRDRRTRLAALAALGGIALALLASLGVFGVGILSSYAANGPGARSPQLAIDPVVQSLLALLYRALHATPHGTLLQIIAFPPFLLALGVLGLVTLACLWRPADSPARRRLGFWLVASFAVLVYPNTLISTLALLAPAALVAAGAGLAAGAPFALVATALALVWAVPGWVPVQAGWTALLVWSAFAALILAPRSARDGSRAAAALSGRT